MSALTPEQEDAVRRLVRSGHGDSYDLQNLGIVRSSLTATQRAEVRALAADVVAAMLGQIARGPAGAARSIAMCAVDEYAAAAASAEALSGD